MSALDLDDSALVHAARGLDSRALSELWRRHAGLVRGVLRRSLGPTADLDDHAQEVFLRLFCHLSALREPAALRSFVLGITARVVRSEIRRRIGDRRRQAQLASIVLDQRELDEPEARELACHASLLLNRAGDEARQMIVLRHVEGLELHEIANTLCISVSTAKRKLTRASERLQTLMSCDPVLCDLPARKEAA